MYSEAGNKSTENTRNIGPEPCQTCTKQWKCSYYKLACNEYSDYTNGSKKLRVDDRSPNHKIFIRLFPGAANG